MKTVLPRVELISDAPSVKTIYSGFRRCYSDKDYPEFAATEKMEAFVSRMMQSGHESPLEHLSMTFHVTCSRACSHQLVRHRIASYSQISQRYVKEQDFPIIVPPAIAAYDKALQSFMEAVTIAEEEYKELLIYGMEAEDARFILPNCSATHIQVTMNCRALLHFFEERCCARAQWEIRTIALLMLDICQRKLPCVFQYRGAKCERRKLCPEAKGCGRYTMYSEVNIERRKE